MRLSGATMPLLRRRASSNICENPDSGHSLQFPENNHQLVDFSSLFVAIAGRYCILDTMSDVILENLLFDSFQCCPYGRDLRDDFDAVSIALNHSNQAANLAFNAIQAFETRAFRFILHHRDIPGIGIFRKSTDTPDGVCFVRGQI